jgi:hypothetical protein
VHIPHELTWSHEYADPPATGYPGYHTLDHVGLLPALLRHLEQEAGRAGRTAASA